MSSVLRSIEGISGNALGESLAFGVGFALGAALDPVATGIRQEAWKADPMKAPDAGTLAAGVAQGQVDEDAAREWAKEHGYGDNQFDALVSIASTGPPIGLAFAAWRRNELTDDEFTTTLRRSGLEAEWDHAMRALKNERLDLGAIATAVHRGLLAGPGLIVREPPEGSGKIPRPPQSNLDATKEAAAHGVDAERLRVLIGNTGLPLALGEMLRLLNMGHVTEDDVRIAVAESNLRNEYMDAALLLRRQLPTARDYLENALRGYRTLDEALHGAALHGMTREDATMIYQNQGRPMALRQITQALARGGKFEPEPGEIRDPYRAAIVEGNLKPAYYDLAYAARYTYPSSFAIRGLAQAGTLTRHETEDVLLKLGWPPDFAAKVAESWSASKPSGGASHTAKAQTQLWTATHKAYVVDETDDATATAKLEAAGVPAAETAAILGLWREERELVRLTLTTTQVKKAFKVGKFTRDEALAYLDRLGLNAPDSATLLDE